MCTHIHFTNNKLTTTQPQQFWNITSTTQQQLHGNVMLKREFGPANAYADMGMQLLIAGIPQLFDFLALKVVPSLYLRGALASACLVCAYVQALLTAGALHQQRSPATRQSLSTTCVR
jgi:hypothetical protein